MRIRVLSSVYLSTRYSSLLYSSFHVFLFVLMTLLCPHISFDSTTEMPLLKHGVWNIFYFVLFFKYVTALVSSEYLLCSQITSYLRINKTEHYKGIT